MLNKMPLDPTPLVATVPVIPVLTIQNAADAVPLARALVAGGLRVIEVTLRTDAAIDAIEAVAAEVSDCVVGAGTVTEPRHVDAVVAGLAGEVRRNVQFLERDLLSQGRVHRLVDDVVATSQLPDDVVAP